MKDISKWGTKKNDEEKNEQGFELEEKPQEVSKQYSQETSTGQEIEKIETAQSSKQEIIEKAVTGKTSEKSADPMAAWKNIGFDVLCLIFEYLPFSLLFTIRLVSRQWREVIDKHSAWVTMVHPTLLTQSNKASLEARTQAKKIYFATQKKLAEMKNSFFSTKSISEVYKDALIKGDVEVVAHLLRTKKVGINDLIDYADHWRFQRLKITPLILAATYDHYSLVFFLLREKADIEYKYSYFASANYVLPREVVVNAINMAKEGSETHALLYIAKAENAINKAENSKMETKESDCKSEETAIGAEEESIKAKNNAAKNLLHHVYENFNREYVEKYFQKVAVTKTGILMTYSDLEIKIIKEWLEEFRKETPKEKNCYVM